MTKTIPLARKNDLVIQELENEILIYDLKTNKVFGLNETSALVWQFSNGEKTISEIAKIVSQKLNLPITEEFVWIALRQLKKANLIENEIENHYQGANRREVIRRVGLASMVVLPMISSFIAPSALHAQSGGSCGTAPFALNCNCVSSSDCQSGCCGLRQFPAILSNTFCIPPGSDAPGVICTMNCECASGCCGTIDPVGPFCTPLNSVAPGGSCRSSCACVSGNCPAGICV